MANGMMIVLNAVSNDSRVVKMGIAMSRVFSNFIMVGTFPSREPNAEPKSEKIAGFRCIKFPHYTYPIDPLPEEDPEDHTMRRKRLAYEQLRDDIASYAKTFGPDLVHSHDMYTMPIGKKIREEAREVGRDVHWIHDVHEFAAGSHHMPPKQQEYALEIEREFLPQADQVITVTEALRQELLNLYPGLRSVEVIFNTPEVYPVHGGVRETLRDRLKIGGAPLAVYSGVVKAMRGVERMIPVLQQLPEWHLALLTGSKSAFTAQLLKDAQTAGVADRIHWHPYVAPSEVVGFLRGVDVGVIPIENYGNAEVALPNKLFEYAFAGVPVVTHRLTALTEFLDTWKIGRVTDFSNASEASAALRECLAGAERKELVRVQSDLLRQYGWEIQARRLIEMYRRFLGISNSSVLDPVAGIDLPKGDLKVLHGLSGAAGQPGTLAHALNEMEGISARSIQMSQSIFGYPADLTYPVASGSDAVVNGANLLRSVARDFDIFHLHYRAFFHDPKTLAFPVLADILTLKAAGKAVVMHFRGSEVRLQSIFRDKSPYHYVDEDDEGTVAAFPEPEKRRFIELISAVADRVFVTDPELATYVPGGEIVERAIDLSSWQDIGVSETDVPLIVHAPSRRGVKGTESILKAIGALRKKGLRFDFQLVEKMPQFEARKVYERADIIVDQLRIGWYGVLAVEAMALGKPVVAYIREDLVHHLGEQLPLANANPGNIEQVLERLIQSYPDRQALSRRARAFAERVHAADVVAAKLANHYREIVRSPRPIDIDPVIDHLMHQYLLAKAQEAPAIAPKAASPIRAAVPKALRSRPSTYTVGRQRLGRLARQYREQGLVPTAHFVASKLKSKLLG